MTLSIRQLTDTDCLEQITRLIHSAYAPHAASGLKYWGTHQSVADTAKRFAAGIGLVAVENEQYVGTAVLRRPSSEAKIELYRDPSVWILSQFCVSPLFKGKGYGKAIHAYALKLLQEQGATTIALDTAAPATALIDMYQSWGYTIVGECDWRPMTNYPSVVMAKMI